MTSPYSQTIILPYITAVACILSNTTASGPVQISSHSRISALSIREERSNADSLLVPTHREKRARVWNSDELRNHQGQGSRDDQGHLTVSASSSLCVPTSSLIGSFHIRSRLWVMTSQHPQCTMSSCLVTTSAPSTPTSTASTPREQSVILYGLQTVWLAIPSVGCGLEDGHGIHVRGQDDSEDDSENGGTSLCGYRRYNRNKEIIQATYGQFQQYTHKRMTAFLYTQEVHQPAKNVLPDACTFLQHLSACY